MGSKFNTILKYGALISLPMILMSVIGYVFTIEASKAYGWLTILVFVLTLFFAQRTFRQEFLEGFASYSKLLGNTMLMIVVASVIMFVYTFIFYQFIAPEQIERMLELADEGMYQRGMDDHEIEQSLVFLRVIYTPILLALMGLLATVLQGFIISLIISIFNKKSRDPFAEAMQDINEEVQK